LLTMHLPIGFPRSRVSIALVLALIMKSRR